MDKQAAAPSSSHGVDQNHILSKGMDQSLREDQWEALLSIFPGGVAICEIKHDPKGMHAVRLLKMNEAFCKHHGLQHDPSDRKLQTLLEQTPFWLTLFSTLGKDGETFLFEYGNSTTRCHYEVQGFRTSPDNLLLLSRDITAQNQRELAAREREQQLWQILATLPGMVWAASTEGVVYFVSPQWARYTGVAQIGQHGFDWLQFLHPQDKQAALEAWRAALASCSAWNLECRLRRHDGQYQWFAWRGAPVCDETGQVLRWVGVGTEIDELKCTQQKLQESECRLSLAMTIAQLGFWEWELATGECYFSPLWKKQIGLQEQELPSTVDTWRSRLHPEDQCRVLTEIRKFLRKPSAEYRFEYRLLHCNGSYRWMVANASVVYGKAAKEAKLVGTQLDVTESKLAEQRMLQAAQHDALTGLPNRSLITEYADHWLAAAKRNHHQGALLFIDLDRFKPINDLYGHEIGDKLLQEVAKRLIGCIRNEDLVGRIGGDEFVVLLPLSGKMQPAATVAQHVIEALSSPYRIESLDLSISASVGISHFPQDGTSLDTLIHAADLAMYQAKHCGRGNSQTFTAAIHSRPGMASSIEAKLKRALDHGGLSLHYQPVIELKSRQIIAAEALLRFTDERGSLISPERFVPIAESSGLIGPLGEWVATEACRQHQAWRKQGLPGITIALNISPLQFRLRGFAKKLQQILEYARVSANAIKIEVRESTVMDSIDDTMTTLQHLRDAGIRIALDNFGTGYSSLSHLSHLPIDSLKMDQSFVKHLEQDKTNQSVIEAVIALGRLLNLEVVGEGIESADELNYLNDHGCNQAQGYFICHPLPAAEFACWYAEQES